jgi:hypothetical protein
LRNGKPQKLQTHFRMPLVLPESQGAQSTPPLSSASSSVYPYPISSVSASPASTPPLPSSASPLSIGVAAHSALQQQAHHSRILQPFPSPRPASSSSFFPPASAAAAAAQTAVAPAAFLGPFRSLPIAAITHPSPSAFHPPEPAQVLSPVSLPDMDPPRPPSGPPSQFPSPRRPEEPIEDHEWVRLLAPVAGSPTESAGLHLHGNHTTGTRPWPAFEIRFTDSTRRDPRGQHRSHLGGVVSPRR